MSWGRSLSWVSCYWVGQRWTRFPFLYWPLYLSHVIDVLLVDYNHHHHHSFPILPFFALTSSLAIFDSSILYFASDMTRHVLQIHIYRSRATLSVSLSYLIPSHDWIHADHTSLPPWPRSNLYYLALSSRRVHPYTPHIQTTHPTVTSLSRRLPRRYGGIRTSQTDRSCTGLGFTMHHIDPPHAALHERKEAYINYRIERYSNFYHFPPFNRTSCVGVLSVYRNRHYRSFNHFILFTLYINTVTLYYSNGYITGYLIISDIYNVSIFYNSDR